MSKDSPADKCYLQLPQHVRGAGSRAGDLRTETVTLYRTMVVLIKFMMYDLAGRKLNSLKEQHSGVEDTLWNTHTASFSYCTTM